MLIFNSSRYGRIFDSNLSFKEEMLVSLENPFFFKYNITFFFKIIQNYLKKLKIFLFSNFTKFFFKIFDYVSFFGVNLSFQNFYFFYFLRFFIELCKRKYFQLNSNSFFSKDYSFLSYKAISVKRLLYNLKKNSLLKKKNLNLIENIFDKEIFIIGDGCDFYQGSITPFYKSQYNWLVCTGLKTDIETNDIDLPTLKESWPEISQKDDLSYVNFYDINYNSFKKIIFKVSNFKNNFLHKFKKQARHFFIYSLHKFMGKQRFLGDNKISFNFKQTFLNYNFCLFLLITNLNNNYLNRVIIKNNFNYSFTKFLKSNFIIKSLNIFINIFNLQLKFVLIFLKSLIFYFNYYKFLKNSIIDILNQSGNFYFHYISFLIIQQNYYKVLKTLLLNKMKKFLKKKFLLNNLNFIGLRKVFFKFLVFIFQILLLFLKYLKKIFKSINKLSYLKYFFHSFLIKRKMKFFLTKLNSEKNLTINEKMNLFTRISALRKYTKYHLYEFFYFYICFLIEWKISLDLIILNKIEKDNIVIFILLEEIKKEYTKLKVLWRYSFFIHIKNFYIFFYSFLDDLIFRFNRLFYMKNTFSNLIKFETFFNFITLFLYLVKWLESYSYKESRFLGSNSLINFMNFTSIFLDRWFFYKNFNKYFDLEINVTNRLFLNQNNLINFKKKTFFLNRKKFSPLVHELMEKTFFYSSLKYKVFLNSEGSSKMKQFLSNDNMLLRKRNRFKSTLLCKKSRFKLTFFSHMKDCIFVNIFLLFYEKNEAKFNNVNLLYNII